MGRRSIFCRGDRFMRRIVLLLPISLLGGTSIAHAQDAVRPSLAGEATSEARQEDINRIPYNLMLGPVRFRVSATVGVEYNDNVNYADVGAQTDWIFTPNVNVDAIWPITQLNTLRLDLGLAYALYVDHSNYDTRGILIAPNSQVAFDIFVGDVRINIHDRMLAQQDPNDSTDYSVGGFAETEITNNVKLRVAGGYQGMSFDHNGSVGDVKDLS